MKKLDSCKCQLKMGVFDPCGGDVILRINGCNVVILLTADNSFCFFKAKEIEL